MRKPIPKIDLLDEGNSHTIAWVATGVILILATAFLFKTSPRQEGRAGVPLRVRFIQALDPPRPAPEIAVPAPVGPAAIAAQRDPAPPIRDDRTALPRREPLSPPPSASTLAGKLYTSDGRARLPPHLAAAAPSTARPPGAVDGDDRESARRLMERPNPIEYRETRFEKDWESDGSLLRLAADKLERTIKSLGSRKHAGPAAPRSPPEVGFNPALHERPQDLGSEATGDAYKAAPIAFEKAPDLEGGASRRILAAIADLEQRYAGCDPASLQRFMQPARSHLKELQGIESVLGRGADPAQARLAQPRADSAYDLSRRALWHADRRMADCLRE